MRFLPWTIAVYELMDDFQAIWRVFSIVSPIPLP